MRGGILGALQEAVAADHRPVAGPEPGGGRGIGGATGWAGVILVIWTLTLASPRGGKLVKIKNRAKVGFRRSKDPILGPLPPAPSLPCQ